MARKLPLKIDLSWQLALAIAALWLATGLVSLLLVSRVVTATDQKELTVAFATGEAPDPDATPIYDSQGRDLSGLITYSPEEETEDSPARAITLTSEAVQPMAVRRMQVILTAVIVLMVSLSSVGTYFMVRGHLRPMRRFQDSIRTVNFSTLSARVSVEDAGQELEELVHALNDLMARLETDFDRQSWFVWDAAHELRRPLAALRANLEVVQQNPEATREEYLALADVQERMTHRLERLIDDLLALSEGGQIQRPQPVTLGCLLEEVRQDLQHLSDEKEVQVQLEGDLGVTVPGDESLLSRALSNLMENAILYNRPGGRVVVTVSRNEDRAVIEVSDTGVSIPPDDQERMFDRLYRGERARSLNAHGAGLGLSIARHLVERHGGTLRLRESSSQGTTFEIRLPGASLQDGSEP